jgi:hypothetical protein
MPYAQQVFARHPHHPNAQSPHGGLSPVGHQLEEQPSATSRTLRFAWFVFGVAFGIGFTFFASGVVPGLKREEPPAIASAAPAATFPPPAPIPSSAQPQALPNGTQLAPPVDAPPPVQAQAQEPAPFPVQAPQPVFAPPPSPPAITPGQLPQARPPQAAPPQMNQRVASAPPPRTRRASAPSGGGGGAPRALPNSGSVEAPDSESGGGGGGSSSSSSSSSSAKTAEVPKDLFGAALNP